MEIWIKTIIETIFGLGLFVNAILFIPQIISLYKAKDSKEISLLTFAGFNLIQLFTLLHGYLHDDYLLVLGYFLSLITCGTVTVMIIVYRRNK